MNPKQRLLEIYSALPELTRTISGAVKQWSKEEYGTSYANDGTEDQMIQIAEAAWHIGAERRARLEITDAEFWRGEAEEGMARIRDLESREAEAEPVAWLRDQGTWASIGAPNPFTPEAIPLFRLRKYPQQPTPPSVAGTSPEQSADGGTSPACNVIVIHPCMPIHSAACRAVQLCEWSKYPTQFDFNGNRITVKPGETTESVEDRYFKLIPNNA